MTYEVNSLSLSTLRFLCARSEESDSSNRCSSSTLEEGSRVSGRTTGSPTVVFTRILPA